MKSRIIFNTYFRLTGGYLLVFLLSVAILGLISISVASQHFEEQLNVKMETEANQLMVDFYQDGMDELRHDVRERVNLDQPGRMLYSILHKNGSHEFDSIPFDEVEARPGIWRADLGLKIIKKDLADGATLVVASHRDGLALLRRSLANRILLVILATLVVGLGGGLLLTSRYMKRLNEIRTTSADFGAGKMKARVPLSGKQDIFDEVANAVNGMLARIESLILEVQRVSSHVAHELRTPIGHTRQKLEVLSSQPDLSNEHAAVIRESIEDLDDTLNVFSAILRLSEINSGQRRSHFVVFNVEELIGELFETYEVISEESGKSLVLGNQAVGRVKGDPYLFRQMVVNLIENAIQHTAKGTKIRLLTRKVGGRITILVEDDGVGLQNPELAGVPFATRNSTPQDTALRRRSTGLGLAIVQAIARLHDFTLRFENSNGLRVSIEMATV